MFDLNAIQSALRELGFDAWLFYDFRGSNALARSILKLEGGMNSRRFLYLVQNNGVAMRYGIGVGRDGFQWNGLLRVTRKSEWPDWTPPPEMIKRQPYLPRFMAGGPGNPMGARALYLGQTIYRIHGTNAPHTIGHAVSSGCFRLVNSEIEDLYGRVAVGAKVIVQQ